MRVQQACSVNAIARGSVMPGLVPGIDVPFESAVRKTRMAGSSSAMTAETDGTTQPNFCLASFAPAPNAASFASAISRRIGAMPQFVVATMLLTGTNFDTASITVTTSSAVSTVSLQRR